ncbi:TPA: LOW QUALITY PROTEIN: hypothetical protein N0F65_005255, partial [Lagenidium giganteum]
VSAAPNIADFPQTQPTAVSQSPAAPAPSNIGSSGKPCLATCSSRCSNRATNFRHGLQQNQTLHDTLSRAASSSKRTTQKKKDPPVFAGRADEALDLWIFSTEEYYCEYKDEMEDQMSSIFVNMVLSNLGIDATSWYRELKTTAKAPITWAVKALSKLHDMRFSGSQSDYTCQFHQILNQLDVDLPEIVKRWFYQQNLRAESLHISTHVPTDLAETIDLAQSFEDAKASMSRSKNDVPPLPKKDKSLPEKKRDGSKEKTVMCHNCGQPGHHSPQCPMWKPTPSVAPKKLDSLLTLRVGDEFALYKTNAYVLDIPEAHDVLLGMPWLRTGIPDIDWPSRTVRHRSPPKPDANPLAPPHCEPARRADRRQHQSHRSIGFDERLQYHRDVDLITSTRWVAVENARARVEADDVEFCFFPPDTPARPKLTWDALKGHPLEATLLKYKDTVFQRELPQSLPSRRYHVATRIELTDDGPYMISEISHQASSFNRLIQSVFKDMAAYCRAYVNDVFVFTTSRALMDHAKAADAVLQRCEERQLYVKFAKSVFGAAEIPCLRDMVGRHGVRMDPANVRVIHDWPMPTPKRQMQSFLGTCVYVSNANDRIVLDVVARNAFNTLRDRFVKPPVLQRLDISHKDGCFRLRHRWLDRNGTERVIAYGGRKMPTAELMYPTREMGLLAAMYATELWKVYLIDKPFHDVGDFHDEKVRAKYSVQLAAASLKAGGINYPGRSWLEDIEPKPLQCHSYPGGTSSSLCA